MTGAREQSVVRASRKVLHAAGAFVCKPDSRALKGVPDDCATFRGRSLWLEYKRPTGGVLTPMQRHRGEQIMAAGGIWLVVTDAQQVRDALAAIDLEIDQAGRGKKAA